MKSFRNQVKTDVKAREQVVEYLDRMRRSCKRITFTINGSEISKSKPIKLSLHDFRHQLETMEALEMLRINRIEEEEDVYCYINITLLEPFLEYKENKRLRQIENRDEWIRFLIPVFISVIALGVSIIALIR